MEGTAYLLCQASTVPEILRAVDHAFGTETPGSGNQLTLRNGGLTVEISAYGADLGEECVKFIREQVNAVCGHFAPVETAHTDIKINVLHQLTSTKGFVHIRYTYPGREDSETQAQFLPALCAAAEELHGLLLTEDGTALRNGQGQLIFSDAGESDLSWFLPWERPLPPDFFDGAPSDALRRRNESLDFCKARYIHVTEWLPLIESEGDAKIPAPEEIAGRAAALLIVSVYSECLLQEKMSPNQAREFVAPIIEGYGAERFFSPKERAYLDNDSSTEQARIQFIWQYEPLLVMLWALGYEAELFYPDRICDVPALARTMREHDTIDALLRGAKPRSADALLSAADLIFRLDWACVDARIHGLPAPAGMDGGVVMERHKALNWLVTGEEWDLVDTST